MKKFKLVILALALFFIFPLSINASEKKINIYMFEGDGCPHCAAEKKFLNNYLKDKDNIKLYEFEVWYNEKNQELLEKVQKKLNNNESGVPYTIIGDKVIIGFSEYNTEEIIKEYIEEALKNDNYKDYIGSVVGVQSEYNTDENVVKKDVQMKKEPAKASKQKVEVPLLGKINPRTVSLPILSVILGFIDGFNPCAMWILIFLITMMFNMKNRKRMWILGLTFIFTSGIVYLAFMLTWLNLATFISKLSIIKILISTVALGVGIWNLVKFSNALKQDDEGCDVVDTKERKKIMNKIRTIANERKFVIALVGIIVLAASVNIIELMCSIGIPLLFTQILAMNNLSSFEYGTYMLIYILFFLIDDIVVFLIAMATSKITVSSTKYSKYSHLVGGIIMLIIGLLLLIKPELLMFNF